MKLDRVLVLSIMALTAACVVAQITPPKPEETTVTKPTENWEVFKGAKTYYVYDNPMIEDKRHLQGVAMAFEKYAALTPAETPDKADVKVRCYQVVHGKPFVYSRPGYGGVVTTQAKTPDYFYYEAMKGDEVVFGWTPTGAYHGWDFGKKVAKKIAKVNDKK